MQSSERSRWQRAIARLGVVALFAAGLVVVSTVATSTPAHAAPVFQMPVPCGQSWTTSTHGGHASEYMVDMISNGGSTQGTPALASAAGTVVTSAYYSDAGNMVVIDHGDGWQTRYLHLDRRDVSVGQSVAQGTQIGIVGATGEVTGAHLHYEQKLNGSVVQAQVNGHYIPVTWSYFEHFETSNNCGGGTPGQYWVDTFANAPGHDSPGGTQTGTLYAGTNYVFCKVWGPEVRVGEDYNHWWLKTDLDEGPAGQWVSAYYLANWGNDEAKDNNGTVIPDC